MSRPLRREYAGAVYHVMARGNHGQKLSADEATGGCVSGWVKAALGKNRRESHSGPARPAPAAAAAGRMLAAGLRGLGLKAADLSQQPKGQTEKPVLAWWLPGQTRVPRRWLAEQLGLGHATRVSQAVTGAASNRCPDVMRLKKQLLEQAI